MLAVSVLLTTGCGGNNAHSDASPSPTALGVGIVAKGIANDGKGDYLQTTIADTDPAMKYNPSIADDAAKAHYSEADLTEAQKVIVKFIAEEGIDSTLNGGSGNVDGWYAAHKDEILPANQAVMLGDLKAGKSIVATENWMARKSGYSYVHGTDMPRVTTRTITPEKFRYLEKGSVQGVMLDTKVSYSMAVTGGTHGGVQSTTGEVSFSVAKDAADGGKWKIAGYKTAYHTTQG
jgi:hypothetical protein